MEPHRDRAVRQQRRRVLGDDRVGVIDAEHEVRLAIGGTLAVLALHLADRELVGAERVLRSEIARADAVRTAEQPRHLGRRHRRHLAFVKMGFERLAERGPDVPRQRIVAGQAFVGAFDDDDVLLTPQRVDDRRLGERADHVDVD